MRLSLVGAIVFNVLLAAAWVAPVGANGNVETICLDRRVPEGTVPAVCKRLLVLGDDEENAIQISVPDGSGSLLVGSAEATCDDPDDIGLECTTVNGGLEAEFSQIRSVIIELLEGDDFVLVFPDRFDRTRFVFSTGDGDDEIVIEDARFSSATLIETGDGADTVTLTGVDRAVRFRTALRIEAGAGADSISMENVDVGGDFDLRADDGSDEVLFTEGVFRRDADIRLGDGDDSFLTGLGQEYRRATTLDGGDGDDFFDLTLNDDLTNWASFTWSLNIQGYDGDDTLFWDESVELPDFDEVTIFEVESCPLGLEDICEL